MSGQKQRHLMFVCGPNFSIFTKQVNNVTAVSGQKSFYLESTLLSHVTNDETKNGTEGNSCVHRQAGGDSAQETSHREWL